VYALLRGSIGGRGDWFFLYDRTYGRARHATAAKAGETRARGQRKGDMAGLGLVRRLLTGGYGASRARAIISL